MSTFSFQCFIIFKKHKTLEPSSSSPRVDGNICVKGVICKKFNSVQFLYEAFFNRYNRYSRCIRLSPHQVELGVSKDWYVCNIMLY